jgi:crotonobetainyl-CoA:carnitine CoA-transferase CaiB-like acyl-CoA transferase
MPSHGKSGPESHHVAYGTNVEQLAGLASISGYAGMGPHKSPIAYGDPNAGAIAAAAAIAALHRRERTGEGARIEVAQWEALVGVIGEHLLGFQMDGVQPEGDGSRYFSRLQGTYPCAGDDAWVAISVGTDVEFAALCATIGSQGLARDPRFADVVSRRRNQDEVDAIIGAWTAERSAEDAVRALQAAGVAAAPFTRIPALMDDPHLVARGFWESVAHPQAGEWRIEGPTWRMSETPAHVRMPAPCFGEHNDYVFRELLGLSDDEVRALEAEGVTADTPNVALHS